MKLIKSKKIPTLFFAICLLFIFLPEQLNASHIDLTLVAPQKNEKEPLTAGTQVFFNILFTNSDDLPKALSPYDNLKLVLANADGEQIETIAVPYPGMVVEKIAAKGFVKQAYQFGLPDQFSGNITLALADKKANTVIFNAGKPIPPKVSEQTDPQKKSVGVLKDLQHPFYNNFSTYEPIYFLFGIDPGLNKSKFQLSFKYRLFNLENDRFLKSKVPWLERLHFAYTQTAFWDLESSSAPFEDSRYMPEIFYYNDNIDLNLYKNTSFGFQTGYQHESNGRGGELSRSTNYLYIKPVAALRLSDDIYLKIAPKAWIYVNNDNETNPDIADYRGYVDLETKIGSINGFVLETHFRPAKKGNTLQLDLSYPMKRIIGTGVVADFYLHAQYYTGYMETLLNNSEKEDILRLGLSLIR